MGCSLILVCRHSHGRFTISLLILLIPLTLNFHAQGRKLQQADATSMTVEEEKTVWRVRIGSSPPRCEGICGSCRHCEAIQVPATNSQIKVGIHNSDSSDDDSTNYKPLSWKCKCGNFIFNP